MKRVLFLAPATGADVKGFQDWFLGAARELARTQPKLDGIIADLALHRDAPERRAYEVDLPPVAVVAELWAKERAPLDAAVSALDALGLRGRTAACDAYDVSESIVLDRRPPLQEGETPGVKYVGRIAFHADLPLSAARRSWSVHADLAVRSFVKLEKYVQNVVEDAAGPNGIGGIPQLYFPSIDVVEELVPGTREQILHDLKHFVRAGIRLYTREIVIKVPPASG